MKNDREQGQGQDKLNIRYPLHRHRGKETLPDAVSVT